MPESSQYKQEFRSLGPGNLQAAPGDHVHDGVTSKGPVSYTPAWTTASNPQPAIGNGSITGRYVYLGKMIHLYIQLTMGTTTTYGLGGWSFSLPVAGDTGMWTQMGLAWDSSASAWESVQAVYPGSGSTITVRTLVTVGTFMTDLSSTVPFTWATGDRLVIQGTYGYA